MAVDKPRAGGLVVWGLLFLVGWIALVWVAISYGQHSSWVYSTLAGVGAAACLFVAMLFWARLRAVKRGEAVVRRAPTHRA